MRFGKSALAQVHTFPFAPAISRFLSLFAMSRTAFDLRGCCHAHSKARASLCSIRLGLIDLMTACNMCCPMKAVKAATTAYLGSKAVADE